MKAAKEYTIIDELTAVRGIIDNGGNQFAKQLIMRKIVARVDAVGGFENALEVFDLKLSEAQLLHTICTVA
jgi:hypothetical protein